MPLRTVTELPGGEAEDVGARWTLDYPERTDTAAGPARLRALAR
jgi:hypothetical protein